MNLNSNEKLYIWHELLRHLGMFTFYSFGALLFYDITLSITSVFIIGSVYFGAGILSRSILLPLFIAVKRKVGIVRFMGIGLGVVATVNTILFTTSQLAFVSLPFILLLMGASSIGSGMYWIFSNTIKLVNIGNSLKPATYTSYLIMARIIAAIISTTLGILLSFSGNFLFMLIFSSLLLFISLLPLSRMTSINCGDAFNLKNIFCRASPLALLANVKLTPEFLNYAIPIFFLISFESLPRSVLITGTSYIIAVVLSYFTGRLKDQDNNDLLLTSAASIVIGFLVFTQIDSTTAFIVATATLAVCSKALSVGANARLGKEMVRTERNIEFIAGIEVARNIGSMLALLLFLTIFLISNTLPQWIFGLGAIFIIPEALYSNGYLAKNESNRD